jgi:hypothetical protein
MLQLSGNTQHSGMQALNIRVRPVSNAVSANHVKRKSNLIMKKFVALMALVAFTFAVQADCSKCTGDKQDCEKAKTEGKCSKDTKCCSKDAKCAKDSKCQKDTTSTTATDKKDDKK